MSNSSLTYSVDVIFIDKGNLNEIKLSSIDMT